MADKHVSEAYEARKQRKTMQLPHKPRLHALGPIVSLRVRHL